MVLQLVLQEPFANILQIRFNKFANSSQLSDETYICMYHQHIDMAWYMFCIIRQIINI